MAFSFFKKSDKSKKEEPQSGPKYFDLRVKNIIQETKDAISIVFDHPAEGKISYKAGQFLTLISNVNGKEVRRAYSLCSSPFVDTDLAVTVKRVDNGLMSNWLPDNLKAGSKLKIMEPLGQFTLDYNSA